MAPSFTPKAIGALRERFDELATEYVQELTRRLDSHGEADITRHLAARLPVAAICELVGAPAEEWDAIFEWTEGTIGAADPDYQQDGESAEEAFRRNMGALNGYIVQLVQQRMADPSGTDLVSRLVQGRIDGEPMQLHEILYSTFNLLIAGVGTTRNSITDGIRTLLNHPDQLRALAEDPSLTDRAVEEILRWSAVAPTSSAPASRTRRSAGSSSARARRWRSGTRPPTTTTPSSRTRTASTSRASTTRTSPSAGTDRTSAWAATSPAWS